MRPNCGPFQQLRPHADQVRNCGLLWKQWIFSPKFHCTEKVSDKMHVVVKILLKALANLPHTDFVLCKCLLSQVGCCVAGESPK